MKKKLGVILSLVFSIGIFMGCMNNETKEEVKLKVGALKGPTAMGMVKMMEDGKYDFSIQGAPDEIVPKIVKGELDLAAVPANLAAILYKNTQGKVQTLAINTLGVLYIVENGASIKSIKDLEGKTIYASGKGATPEYALNYILEKNNLKDKVKVEFKSEHTECLMAITKDKNAIAMLPEPFVTTAMEKNKNIKIALDLNKEWEKVSDGKPLVTGVLVGRKEVIENNEKEVQAFLEEYEKGIEFTNNNIEEAAKLIGKNNIVPTEIAKKAIKNCNIVFIKGEEMKNTLSEYLNVLNKQNPKAIGGKIPSEDFYFIK